MIAFIYIIIALTLAFVVFNVHIEHITNREESSGSYSKKDWLESKYFWMATSMLVFPIFVPVFILSKLIFKIYKSKLKKEENEEN